MATVTESDIKELKELITNLGENLNSRMKSLEDGQKSLEIGQKTLEDGQKSLEIGQAEIRGRLAGLEENTKKIPDLAEKVGELKNWQKIGLVFITAALLE